MAASKLGLQSTVHAPPGPSGRRQYDTTASSLPYATWSTTSRFGRNVLRLADPHHPQPLASTHTIAGDDFALIEAAPAANIGPQLAPGVYLRANDGYYVTHGQQIYLIRRPEDLHLPREVRVLPSGCRLLPRQDWDRELQALAAATEQFAGR